MEKQAMPSSDTYNHLEMLDVLITEKENIGDTTLISVLVLEDQKNMGPHTLRKIPVYMQGHLVGESEKVSAFKIDFPEETYSIVINQSEQLRHIMSIEDEEIFAKVALIHEKNGEKKVYTIMY